MALKKCLVLGALRLTAYTARLCNFSWMRKSDFWRLFAFSRVFSINQGKTKVNWKLFSFQKIYSPKRMNERREDRALPLLTLMITLITLIITLCITDTTSHNFHGIVLPPGHWWLSISLVSPICDHPVGWSENTTRIKTRDHWSPWACLKKMTVDQPWPGQHDSMDPFFPNMTSNDDGWAAANSTDTRRIHTTKFGHPTDIGSIVFH